MTESKKNVENNEEALKKVAEITNKVKQAARMQLSQLGTQLLQRREKKASPPYASHDKCEP